MSDQCFSPPELAKRWKVSPDKIIAMIRAGKLQAFDVSMGTMRPRYRITIETITNFEQMQAVQLKQKNIRRKQRVDHEVTEYF